MEHTFQTYCDICNSNSTLTVITVYAGGNDAVQRSLPFFAAYKYYKIGPVTVKLVPASTMPVDPTGLSTKAGESTTIDPRDQLTPGLARITNGEDFYTKISALTSAHSRAVFTAMMMDQRWFKFSLQQGVTKTATPFYWHIGQIRQDYYPGAIVNLPAFGDPDNPLSFTTTAATAFIPRNGDSTGPGILYEHVQNNHSSGRGIFQTGQHGQLGWMPTDALIQLGTLKGATMPAINNVPQVELMRIVLPIAYKTIHYYRLFVTETIYFKDPVPIYPEYYEMDDTYKRKGDPMLMGGLDRFIRMQGIKPAYPQDGVGPSAINIPKVKNEGGNTSHNNIDTQ